MTVFRKAADGWVEVPAADDTDIVGSLESFVAQASDDDRLLISTAQARQLIAAAADHHRLLAEAVDVVNGLADQQAMPDPWYEEFLARAKEVLDRA